MCGIAGGWWKSPDKALHYLHLSLKKINHRGPDDGGCQLYPLNGAAVALGHTRLSIIDLSDAGHQPMHSRDGRWAIVFNGEIYNYRELRTELQNLGHVFRSDSDTEVLLSAWLQWGSGCLPRLVGMFAFAILDKATSTLTCVRDAFGIKPLFYTAADEYFAFASELPAVLALMQGKPQLNWQRAYDYLAHGDYDSGPDSFFAGVKHLPAGHWLAVDLASGRAAPPHRWWTPCIEERTNWRFDDAVEQVREQFLHSIRLHLRSDVPLGAALSGGIDSSAVVCAMRHLEPRLHIKTFSFIATGTALNEERWVDRINAHVGATAHKVSATANELANDLDDMIRAQGEPFGSTSIYAQYRVFKRARESGVTVTLDGQGADEMLAGYAGYPGPRLRSMLETGHLFDAWTFLSTWAQWPGRSKVQAAKALAGQCMHGSLYNTLRALNGDETAPSWLRRQVLEEHGVMMRFPNHLPVITARGRRLVAELGQSLSVRGLNALLRHGDRNSMRFSIESRVPFLTIKMADLLLSIPEEYLISPRGETKHVFRAAMRGIVPEDILRRRDKIGFSTPEQSWILSLPKETNKWLTEDLKIPFLDQSKIISEFNRITKNKKKSSAQAWRWINFHQWYKHYFL